MDYRIEIIIKLLEDDFYHKNSPVTLAGRVRLSPSHLRRLFKIETGISLGQYHKLLRLRKAREFLESTLLNVKEIMFRVGVKDESHFVRDFKKRFGVSPVRYRSEQSASNINWLTARLSESSDPPINSQNGQQILLVKRRE
jgi:two-component system response regulator YesN